MSLSVCDASLAPLSCSFVLSLCCFIDGSRVTISGGVEISGEDASFVVMLTMLAATAWWFLFSKSAAQVHGVSTMYK